MGDGWTQVADGGGEGVRSACDGLAGVGEEGLVPFPEGGEGLGSAMEGGPRGSMRSNGISSWAVSESYLCGASGLPPEAAAVTHL